MQSSMADDGSPLCIERALKTSLPRPSHERSGWANVASFRAEKPSSYRVACSAFRVWIDKADRRKASAWEADDQGSGALQTLRSQLVIEPIYRGRSAAEQYRWLPPQGIGDPWMRFKRPSLESSQATERWSDADLSGYFDSIPRKELMQIRWRVVSAIGRC